MNTFINTEKLADVQRVTKSFEQLPESARLYIAGYTEGVASVSRLLAVSADTAEVSSAHKPA